MKNYTHKILLVLFAGVMMTSCKKNLIEYNPSGAESSTLLGTPQGFEAAVNAVYTYNRSIYGKEEGYAMLEAGTDLWAAAASNGAKSLNGIAPTTPLSTYQGLVSDNQYINSNFWVPSYAAINLCNTALKAIDNAGLKAERRPVLEGELRFMRAWYYYHLVETFGDVHFTLEPTDGMLTTANRTPVATIYTQIFEDVKFAIQNLPPNTVDYGRVTKPAAEAFMARLSLTRGNNQEASNYAYNVIRNYGFSLMPKYSDLWKMANEINTEVVWSVNYASNLALNAGSNEGHSLFNMAYTDLPGMTRDVVNGVPNARWMPTLFMLQLFNEKIDSRYDASFKQAWIANNPNTNPNDPKNTYPKWTAAEVSANPVELAGLEGKYKFTLGDTAVFITKYAIDNTQQNLSKKYRFKTYDVEDVYGANGLPKDRFHYISFKKFEDPTRATANEAQSSRNAVTIRLAEMYLIASEAHFNVGKLDSATRTMNVLRRRAAIPGNETAMEITSANLSLDFFLNERARELGGEQLRWLDLKRTGKLLERVKAYNPDAAAYIQNFHVLRPIPLAQIGAVTNKGEFKQNDGY